MAPPYIYRPQARQREERAVRSLRSPPPRGRSAHSIREEAYIHTYIHVLFLFTPSTTTAVTNEIFLYIASVPSGPSGQSARAAQVCVKV